MVEHTSKEDKEALVADQEQKKEQGFESPVDLEPTNDPPTVLI